MSDTTTIIFAPPGDEDSFTPQKLPAPPDLGSFISTARPFKPIVTVSKRRGSDSSVASYASSIPVSPAQSPALKPVRPRGGSDSSTGGLSIASSITASPALRATPTPKPPPPLNIGPAKAVIFQNYFDFGKPLTPVAEKVETPAATPRSDVTEFPPLPPSPPSPTETEFTKRLTILCQNLKGTSIAAGWKTIERRDVFFREKSTGRIFTARDLVLSGITDSTPGFDIVAPPPEVHFRLDITELSKLANSDKDAKGKPKTPDWLKTSTTPGDIRPDKTLRPTANLKDRYLLMAINKIESPGIRSIKISKERAEKIFTRTRFHEIENNYIKIKWLQLHLLRSGLFTTTQEIGESATGKTHLRCYPTREFIDCAFKYRNEKLPTAKTPSPKLAPSPEPPPKVAPTSTPLKSRREFRDQLQTHLNALELTFMSVSSSEYCTYTHDDSGQMYYSIGIPNMQSWNDRVNALLKDPTIKFLFSAWSFTEDWSAVEFKFKGTVNQYVYDKFMEAGEKTIMSF